MKMQLQLRRHLPFTIAAGLGLCGFVFFWLIGWSGATVGAACLFFLTYLVLTGIRIPQLTPTYLKANAAATDEPAAVIFLITLGTIITSLVCLFALINQDPRTRDILQVLLSLATVALGWFTIHTMAALHYAHLYWRPAETDDGKPGRRGGLEFPGGTKPGAWDFLYFAFVIGMTAQTSDTAITTTSMRKFNLTHAIVSFFFNTVLVAVAVNVAVAMAGFATSSP
jgi:uncharacterized membrane protein